MATPFHFPRHRLPAGAGAVAALPHAWGTPVSHPAFHYYYNHQLNFAEFPVPNFNFYGSSAFGSDPRFGVLPHHFSGAGHAPAPVPFSGRAMEFGAPPAAEFGYRNGGEQVEDLELYRREEGDEVRFSVDVLDRQREGRNLNLGLSLGFGQVDEDMDDNGEDEVDLELKLGLGSETDREGDPSEFRGFYGEELNFPQEFHEIGADSERIVGFDPRFCPNVVHPIDAFDYPPLCYDHFVLLDENQEYFNRLVEDSAYLSDWYGVRGESDVPVHPDWYYGDGMSWEMLLAVDQMHREMDDPMDDGVVEESMNEWRGNPPAARSVVETLPVVTLSYDEVKGKELECAICFAEFSVGERVMQLPCRHYYHGECILPWLDLRNTCPVCRYELPTDDPEYENEEWEMEE